MDPSGKNKKLAKHAASSNGAILQPLDFKFTLWDTPQHNSLAKVAFLYMAGKACAMMGSALVPDDRQLKVALEAIACATQLGGLTIVTVNGKEATHDVHMFGVTPNGLPTYVYGGGGSRHSGK